MRLALTFILVLFWGNAEGDTPKCAPGWKHINNYCYYFNNRDTVTWKQANVECSSRGSKLLRVESVNEWVSIKNNMANNPSGNGFWTALNDLDTSGASNTGTGVWLWGADEYPVNNTVNTHWDKEPDNNDNEDCCAINLAAKFSDEQCSLKTGYICEQDNTGALCTVGWLGAANSCYFVSNMSDPTTFVTWSAAKARCAVNGSHLLTINSQQEADYFTTNIPTYWSFQTTRKWWTGLNDKQTEGHFQWANNDPYTASFVQWNQEPNNILHREHCGTILQKGTFSDRDCSQPNNYICRKSLLRQKKINFGCGYFWTRAGQKCYRVVNDSPKTWSDARSSCQSMGGDLMKIENKDEMQWLSYNSKTAQMSYGGYWIGLNDLSDRTNRVWKWADGSSSDSSVLDWNHEPNNFNGSQDCAAMSPDGVFSDSGCYAFHNGYICEMAAQGACPTGWQSSPTVPNRCYYIGKTYQTWVESVHKCTILSGNGKGTLLALDTKPEKDFILSLLQNVKTPFAFWTALNDRLAESVWVYPNAVDNTPTSFSLIKWNSEPNNWHGAEDCVSAAFGGRLNDMACSKQSGYICEKMAGSSQLESRGPVQLALVIVSIVLTAITTRH